MAIAKWVRTPEQQDNLLKLAAYLKTLEDPKVFDIEGYARRLAQEDDGTVHYQNVEFNIVELINLTNDHPPQCGTVCCAIGMTPFVFPEAVQKFVQDNPYEASQYWVGWHTLSQHLFGKMHEEYWAWMFEYFWGRIDNTPEGAALRIEYFVLAKRPPLFYTRDTLRFKEPQFVEKYKKWRARQLKKSVSGFPGGVNNDAV